MARGKLLNADELWGPEPEGGCEALVDLHETPLFGDREPLESHVDELAHAVFGFAQCPLGLRTLGHVLHHLDEPLRPPFGGRDGEGVNPQGAQGAVLAPVVDDLGLRGPGFHGPPSRTVRANLVACREGTVAGTADARTRGRPQQAHLRPVRPEDAIAIPPGKKHKLWNTGSEPLRLLCCCAPAYEHEDTVITEGE